MDIRQVKKEQRYWTGREMAQAIELAKTHTVKEVAEMMGRTFPSVRGMLRRRGGVNRCRKEARG